MSFKSDSFFSSNVPINGGISGGISGGIALFERIRTQPGISSLELAEKTGEAQRTVERWIKQLKDSGKIEYRGSKKTGGYYPL